MLTTITVRELSEGYEAMQELAARKLKLNPSFWLARQVRHVATEYASFIDQRTELIKQYGAESPPGSGTFTVLPENTRAFSDALGELLKGTLEITVEPRPAEFLALEELEPRLLAATWFLWADETAAA